MATRRGRQAAARRSVLVGRTAQRGNTDDRDGFACISTLGGSIRCHLAPCGAGDGTRTRDSLLGRQELYQTELLPHTF